jgi:hypothetical protein
MHLEREAEIYRSQKQRMENDETYQRYLAQERKEGRGPKQVRRTPQQKAGRGAPTERAAKTYMEWRQKQIKEHRQQQLDKHQRLLKQQGPRRPHKIKHR